MSRPRNSGSRASVLRSASAGGQLEQPCDVKSSSTTGVAPIDAGVSLRRSQALRMSITKPKAIVRISWFDAARVRRFRFTITPVSTSKIRGHRSGNMRLVTRSDFDGLVCAVLLKEVVPIDAIEFVHPKDVQDGKVTIGPDDIVTNLPYQKNVGLWFDHHSSETVRNE